MREVEHEMELFECLGMLLEKAAVRMLSSVETVWIRVVEVVSDPFFIVLPEVGEGFNAPKAVVFRDGPGVAPAVCHGLTPLAVVTG